MQRQGRGFRGWEAVFCLSSALWRALVVVLLISGCSTRQEARSQRFMRVVTPQPPGFLIGPLAVLFTNWPGFSAQAEVQMHTAVYADRNSSGELFGSGTKLLYAPHSQETTDTHRQAGRYSFVWDVSENRGYVMSDALQGYAPIASGLRVTNVSVNISHAAAQRLSGHTCEPATAAVQLNDGSTTEFELLRAIDLKGFPIHVEKKANPAFSLSLSKIHLEAEPADAFAPPDGFTKYPTPEAMADELAARQNNLRRRSSEPTPMIPGLEQPRY